GGDDGDPGELARDRLAQLDRRGGGRLALALRELEAGEGEVAVHGLARRLDLDVLGREAGVLGDDAPDPFDELLHGAGEKRRDIMRSWDRRAPARLRFSALR